MTDPGVPGHLMTTYDNAKQVEAPSTARGPINVAERRTLGSL